MEQTYLASAGLIPVQADLSDFARRMVAQIHRQIGVYEPKRVHRRVESRGWRQRLENYEWSGRGFAENKIEVAGLASGLESIARKIDAGQQLSQGETRNAQEIVSRIFSWGRVGKAADQKNPDIDRISSVILSALRWEAVGSAPMNSGWTKVAALSTDWVERIGRTPQVIFDSRVAHSMIRNAERLADIEEQALLSVLEQHLRRLPGRGGSRQVVGPKSRWRSGYKQWNAQFFASYLIRLMRDALNQDVTSFGLMPVPGDSQRAWTTRGVEMVLFMDGY